MKDKLINYYTVEFAVNGEKSSCIAMDTSVKGVKATFEAMNHDNEALEYLGAKKLNQKEFTNATADSRIV